MSWATAFFIVGIVLACNLGWVVNNWIRAKHGYPLEDEWGGKTERAESNETHALRAENRQLHEKLDMMQDRMIVLEKIVTDRGYSLSDEIEALRDASPKADSGAPLNIAKKEQA